MSPLARRYSQLVRLLTVLWAVGRSGASQSQPSANVGDALSSDQLLRLIVHDVTSKIQPLVSKLAARIDKLDSRLIAFDSRLNGIEARLNALDFEQGSFDTRLDNLTSRMYSANNRLDSRLDELVSRVDGPASGQSDRLDSVSSRLDGLSSRLDKLANRTDQGRGGRADPRIHPLLPRDCSDLPARARSGIHLLQTGLDCSRPPVPAYCDLDTDGGDWTVIQRRADIEPRQDFNLGWSAYREGFGELDAEFWWGLENLWKVIGPRDQLFELRINLVDFDGEQRYAVYRQFRVASEANGYRLSVSNYTGDAGDSLEYHNGQRFSTKDRDQDRDKRHCAQEFKGGWWFKECYFSHLNGPYLSGIQAKNGGVNWGHWRGYNYSLKESEMKIRPVNIKWYRRSR